MNGEAAAEAIFDLFYASITELFESMGAEVLPAEEKDVDYSSVPIALIDAGSDDLESFILLRIPFTVLSLTYPIEDVLNVSDAVLEDWLAEISNQLVGRFKSNLLKHDCKVQIGLPETFFGTDAEGLRPDDYLEKQHFLEIDSEIVECSLYLQLLSDDINFNLEEQQEDDSVDEGELEMF